MRGVLAIDVVGNVKDRYDSLTEAAYTLGITQTSVLLRIKRGTIKGGMKLVYADDKPMQATPTKEHKPKRPKSEEEKAVKVEGDLERMTRRQMDEAMRKYEKEGIAMERVKYDLWNGIVSRTVCRKKECNPEDLPKVGAIGCMKCRYFRGKCRETQEVICAHYHMTIGLKNRKKEKGY